MSQDQHNHNLYCALRAGFPADLDACAIESAAADPLRYTWRDLERGSAMLANLLASLELPPQSRIAVTAGKSVETLMLYLAVLRAGHVYLPLNSAYQAAELAYFVGNAEPAVLVCAERDFGWAGALAFQAGVRNVFTLDDDRSGTLLQRAAFHADRQLPVKRAAADLAAIVYTSGTTGRSKGAMLSHGNLHAGARVLLQAWCWQGADVLIHALPIFHVHGLFVATHCALLGGSRMIWFNRFSPREVALRLPDASVFMGVPTLYTRLLAEAAFTRECAAGMRLFISGSAPLLAETFGAFAARCGHTVLERYGMSETLMLTSNPCAPASARRAGSAGRPLPGLALRVCGPDGVPLPPGQTGGVEVRGASVFAGYWRMPDKTAEDFTPDGWFRTGDLGWLSEDGYLTLVGRSKDLIISGGYNVYPAEVEGYLNAMEGVTESAVVGVPHPDFGEAVVAVVVARPGAALDAAALVARLKSQIAGFKVPKQVLVASELPRNAMGKVQKTRLREQHGRLFTP